MTKTSKTYMNFGFVLFTMVAALPVQAQSLPSNSSAIPAAALSAMFSGKTYAYQEAHGSKKSMVSWYLATDGSMTGFAESGPSFASGTWTLTDGKLCVSDKWVGSWGESNSNDCQLWAVNGKKLYRAIVGKGDYAAFSPKLQNGDTIAGKISELRKKLNK